MAFEMFVRTATEMYRGASEAEVAVMIIARRAMQSYYYRNVHSVARKQEQKDSSLMVIDAADAPDDNQ
jgi:hypothetical protein